MKHFIFLVVLGLLLSACNGGGGGGGGSGDVGNGGEGGSNSNSADSYTLSGKLTYDSVPIQTGVGLNYAAITQKPIRKIYIEAIDSISEEVVANTSSNNLGEFDLNIPKTSTEVFLRIHAKILNPSIMVQDNTNGDAQYIVETASYPISADADLGTLNAPSGWNAGQQAYANDRISAPFAILDTVLKAQEKVSAAKPSLVFPELKINWSVNNLPSSGDPSVGQIGTSHYRLATKQLYILGKAGIDTDEFDTHVMVHEWGHYFEDNLSRSNNIAGSHGFGELKDKTLAFGEGFGNALSAMIMDPDITYRDSAGVRQNSVSSFSLEGSVDSNPGWFSETSIQEILFDLYDSSNDAGDSLSMGLTPIINIMTTHQVSTRARSSIFSFINGLKSSYPSSASLINTLTTSKSISPVQDDFGTGETNFANWSYNLPVYNRITVGGADVSVKLWGSEEIHNSLGNNRRFVFTASTASTRFLWQSSDSYRIYFYDGDTKVIEWGENSKGAALPVRSYTMTTVPGRVYTIHVQSEDAIVFYTSFINFAIRTDNI